MSVRRAGENIRVQRREKKNKGEMKRELKGIENSGNKETIKRQKRERYAEAH